MKHDPRELAAVQQAASAYAVARENLYSGIHKALRALLSDTLLAVGRMDAQDDLELAQATQRVLQMLDLMRSHLEHENAFVHPVLESRAPGSSELIGDDHVGHVAEIGALAAQTHALLTSPQDARDAAAFALYQRLALFAAHNFEHMNVEETAHNAVLWAHYSDAELMQVHGALVASVPPEEMMQYLRWLVPFMNPRERATLLGGMRQQVPAPVFEVVLQMVRPHLDAREWQKLETALALPVAAAG